MAQRPVWLAKSRGSRSQRAHFSIFVPNAADAAIDPNAGSSCKGTVIHVVGAPMAGYGHEFKRNHDPSTSQDLENMVRIGWVNSEHVADPPTDDASQDDIPVGRMDAEALRVPAPRRNENFMAPVNDTINRRCQEWTMDFIRHLASRNYIDHGAIAIVQAERDPPTHGVTLRRVG